MNLLGMGRGTSSLRAVAVDVVKNASLRGCDHETPSPYVLARSMITILMTSESGLFKHRVVQTEDDVLCSRQPGSGNQ